MSVFRTVFAKFRVKERRDLENEGRPRGRSRSLKMARFDFLLVGHLPFSSYLTLNNRDLEIWVIGH